MNSDSFGLSSRSPEGYANIFIKWGVKVSTDGDYLHGRDPVGLGAGQHQHLATAA